jgi:hypothetical protein
LKELAFVVLGGLSSLFICSKTSANEARTVTISTTPSNAAVFSISKGKKEFLGYSPVSLEFEFPTLQHTHSVLVSKLGYELTRETISSDSLELQVVLKKQELLAARTQQNEAVYDEVERRLMELLYDNDQLETRSTVTGKISILPIEDRFCLTLEVLLFEDSILRKLRRLQRGGESKVKKAELAQEVFAYCEDVVRAIAAKVGDVKQMLLIDLTVNYPLPQVDLQFDRQEIDRFSVQEHRSVSQDGTVTTIRISGWTYSALDTTDISVRERTAALKFIVPVDRVKAQSRIEMDTFRDCILVFQKERAGEQFRQVELKDSGS